MSVPSANITSIVFNVSNNRSIVEQSNIEVLSADLFSAGLPKDGGVYDRHMGTTDNSYYCATCLLGKKNCVGHDGHLVLRYPLMSPMYISDIRKWLKIICFTCGNILVDDKEFMGLPERKRMTAILAMPKLSNSTQCAHCHSDHPKITKDDKILLKFRVDYQSENRKVLSQHILYPHHIAEIFARISDETVRKLGKAAHPRDYILDVIKIPPTTIRPDIRKVENSGKNSSDGLTGLYQQIIKTNTTVSMPTNDSVNIADYESKIFEYQMLYYDTVRGTGNKLGKSKSASTSIALRLKGKLGRFRKNMMGKRTFGMSRATIICDRLLKPYEMGIPMMVAKTLQVAEVVQPYNYDRLMTYVQNGLHKYPGSTKVWRKDRGAEFSIEKIQNEPLQPGDIVYRDVIDGDWMTFNRQPSLKVSNISAMKVVVNRDPNIYTFCMNVVICPYFDADFDGDAQNGILNKHLHTMNEVAMLSSVPNWLITFNSTPAIGEVEDSIVGTFELTRKGVKLSKYNAMLLFRNVINKPVFDKEEYTGYDIISMVLSETPINFSRVPSYYDESLNGMLKYDPSDIKVIIERGVHKQGVLDKKSLGGGAVGGIFHLIQNEYGSMKALDMIYNIQQIAIEYIYQNGLSIGVGDLMLSEKARNAVNDVASDIIHKSELLTERLKRGEIVPPIDKTIYEYFEQQQIEILKVYDDFKYAVMSDIDPETNNIFKMIFSGSKGKIGNFYNMNTSVGQKTINGERIAETLGKRSMPYYQRYSTDPISRGYIMNSYISGMTPQEYICNAMNARFDFITKALSTATTGELNRKAIKNLESCIVTNIRAIVKSNNLNQILYGDDGIDARRIISVVMPTVMMNDADLESKFKYPAKDAVFDQEFAAIVADRKKYRDIFLNVENANFNEYFSDKRNLAVDIARVLSDFCINYVANLKEPTDEELKKMVGIVKVSCDNMKYIFTNNIQRKLQRPMPEYMSAACWLFCMSMRSCLCAANLKKFKVTPVLLQQIINHIEFRYKCSLVSPGSAVGIIAAQSFSQPLTQTMLSATSQKETGAANKSGMVKTKEITGVRAKDKLVNPQTLIPLKPEFSYDQAVAATISDKIQMMQLKQFVLGMDIFHERYGAPVHSKFKSEAGMIAQFNKLNPLLKVPGDLVNWCIRFTIIRMQLVLKNMSIETIVGKLRAVYPDIYVVYTPENNRDIVMRVYIRTGVFKEASSDDVKAFANELLETVIRGVNGITDCKPHKMIRSIIDKSGAIVKDTGRFGLMTTGINMSELMLIPEVDPYGIQSDSIMEIYEVLGIEAARNAIITQLRSIVGECNYRHYLMYADEMCYLSYPTSIEKGGLSTREHSNILLRIGFSNPIQTLEESAINGAEDIVGGVTGPLLIGDVPRVGSMYDELEINEEFIAQNVKSADAVLDEL